MSNIKDEAEGLTAHDVELMRKKKSGVYCGWGASLYFWRYAYYD
jgi:hypothetical protein